MKTLQELLDLRFGDIGAVPETLAGNEAILHQGSGLAYHAHVASMSAHGTSRQFAATQHFGRFWGEADID